MLHRRGAIARGALVAVGSEPVLQVLDLDDGSTLGTLELPDSFATGVVIADGLAFVGGGGGVHVADVADLAAPRWIGALETGADAPYGALVRDTLLGETLLWSNGNSLGAFALECTP